MSGSVPCFLGRANEGGGISYHGGKRKAGGGGRVRFRWVDASQI